MVKELKKKGISDLRQAYNKALIWFFSYPNDERGLSEFAQQLEMSKTTAHEVVKQLVQEQFLVKKEIGRAWRISCNQSHQYNITRKIAYNLEMVYDSEILQEIRARVPNSRAIVLFGSYRKGDDMHTSDIDIAVEVMDGRTVQIIPLGVFPEFGYRKNIQVNLTLFSRNKVDLNLFSNIANGIVLEGFLEVRP